MSSIHVTDASLRDSLVRDIWPTYGQEDTNRSQGIIDILMPRIAEALTEARANALDDALDAIKGEELSEDLDNPRDKGYMQALKDVENAVKQLR